MTHRRTLTLLSVALVFLCCAETASADEVTISSSNIVLPEIDGFYFLTVEADGRHPLASLSVETCPKALCAIYIGEPSEAGSSSESWQDVAPFFQVQVIDDALVVGPGVFPAIVESMKADIDRLRALVTEGISEAMFDTHVLFTDGEELEFDDAPVELSEEFLESDTHFAIPASGSNNYRRLDGSIVRYEFDMTFGFIHAQDKILLLLMFGPGKDAGWSQGVFEEFSAVLAEVNSGG